MKRIVALIAATLCCAVFAAGALAADPLQKADGVDAAAKKEADMKAMAAEKREITTDRLNERNEEARAVKNKARGIADEAAEAAKNKENVGTDRAAQKGADAKPTVAKKKNAATTKLNERNKAARSMKKKAEGKAADTTQKMDAVKKDVRDLKM